MFSFALLNHTLLFTIVFHYLFTMMGMFKIIFWTVFSFFLRGCLREFSYFHTNTVASNNVLNANKEKVENEFHSTVTWLTKFEHLCLKIAQKCGLFYRMLIRH